MEGHPSHLLATSPGAPLPKDGDGPVSNTYSSESSKGKGRATGDEHWTPTGPCHLSTLPPELVDHILCFLSPIDLVAVSATCRSLNDLATADNLWKSLVQANVPGMTLTSPSPFTSFRDLYAAHDGRWFLPKFKLWFTDRELTGKLVIARFDPRTGNIEGYQLVAISSRNPAPIAQSGQWDDDVLISSFEPRVNLHLDRPILRFEPTRRGQGEDQEQGGIIVKRIPVVNGVAQHPVETSSVSEDVSFGLAALNEQYGSRGGFRPELRMRLDPEVWGGPTDLRYSSFILARPLSSKTTGNGRGVWPPPTIPADHRVFSAPKGWRRRYSDLSDEDIPSCRAEASDKAFRIRSWLEIGPAPPGGRLGAIADNNPISNVDANYLRTWDHVLGLRYWPGPREGSQRMAEELGTFATLDPALYTPTVEYPYRGIWVGDYSGHGCEFVLIHQPERTPDHDFNLELMPRRDDETDEDYQQRKVDARIHRGRLEAIKLTGDPNVPRGEHSFIADDLGPGGFVRTLRDDPFAGARVVKSRGHVAGTGFINDHFMETQLILMSHDRLAQYWVEFRHINFFHRINIDDFTKV